MNGEDEADDDDTQLVDADEAPTKVNDTYYTCVNFHDFFNFSKFWIFEFYFSGFERC